LTTRFLEANGIATVIVGSALDIVEHCGVPRYLHVDFPLGNPLGHPYQQNEQLDVVRQALDLVHDSNSPVTSFSDLRWMGGDQWRSNYMKVDSSNAAQLRLLGEENRRTRLARKQHSEPRR